jgi:hypothetical protein
VYDRQENGEKATHLERRQESAVSTTLTPVKRRSYISMHFFVFHHHSLS